MRKIKFIADISSNHCNNLQLAKDLIYSAKESGADYAKFQYWETDNFINKERFNNLKIGHQKNWNKSVYDIYKQYQLKEDWIPILYDECNKVGIEFLLSCYELSKIDIFDQYVKAWKIGSGDIDYIPILEKIASKNKLIFLGCGASNNKEIQEAYFKLKNRNNEVILFLCNTNYSANDNENFKYLNLNVIEQTFKFKGLSDHTKSDIPIIISISLGVKYIERHFKLYDNNSPDNNFSMNPKEWINMLKIANQTIECLGNGIKDIQENEKESRIIQRRSKIDWKRPDSEYIIGE